MQARGGDYAKHANMVLHYGVGVRRAGSAADPAQDSAKSLVWLPDSDDAGETFAPVGVPAAPLAVDKDQIPADKVEQERRIFTEQVKQSGKPDNLIEKIVDGKIEAYYKDVALMHQAWVRDPKKTIGDLVKDLLLRVLVDQQPDVVDLLVRARRGLADGLEDDAVAAEPVQTPRH